MKKITVIFLTVLFTRVAYAQTNVTDGAFIKDTTEQGGPAPAYKLLVGKALNLYYAKNFKEAALTFSEAFRSNGWLGFPDDRYNAACCWALAGYPDSAFYQLNRIKMRYSNYDHIIVDEDLNTLHSDKRWQPLLDRVMVNRAEMESPGDSVHIIAVNDARGKNGTGQDDVAGRKDGDVRVDRTGVSRSRKDTDNVYTIYFYKMYREVANNPAKSYLLSYHMGVVSPDMYDKASYSWRKDTTLSVTLVDSKTGRRNNLRLAAMGQQTAVIEENQLLNMRDLEKYRDETKAMVNEGRYKEANERCIWFYNHALEHDDDMRGIRNSFFLGDWMDLAQVYAPAMQSFKETRDQKAKLILDSAATRALFVDVESLNDKLNEDSKTIELFEFMDKKYPKIAKESFWCVKEPLFEANRYDMLQRYIGDPRNEYHEIHEWYDRLTALDNDTSNTRHNALTLAFSTAGNKLIFVQNTVRLINYCLAINNTDAANDIQKQALAVVDDERLRDVMKEKK